MRWTTTKTFWTRSGPSAGHYHNTLGRIVHPEGDPAADQAKAKAKALWERLEALSS